MKPPAEASDPSRARSRSRRQRGTAKRKTPKPAPAKPKPPKAPKARGRETKEQKRRRARDIEEALAQAYPESRCALAHRNPFELLVATVLSAQTTDLAVNRATPELFRRFPDARSMAQAPEGAIEGLIGSIGLWRAKARSLRGLSLALVRDHGGQVPRTVEELVRLAGVGKKTATAVLGTAHGIAAGVTVDTHMVRINRLLKLTAHTDPDKIAGDLEQLLPPESWPSYTHRIIDHGRLVCVARRPRCGVCPLRDLCPSAFDPRVGYKPENDGREPASKAGLSWVSNPAAPPHRPRRLASQTPNR